MNKLPVTANATQSAKSAQVSPSVLAASPTQASKPIDAANAISHGKTFGDVLARHVSDTKMAENASQSVKGADKSVEKTNDNTSHAKKISNNTAEKTNGDSAQAKKVSDSTVEKADGEASQSKNATDNVAEKTDGDAVQPKKISGNASKKTDGHAVNALPGDTGSSLSPDMLATLIPLNAAAAQGEVATQGVAASQGAVASPGGVISQGLTGFKGASESVAASQGGEADAKDGLDMDKVIHSASNSALARNASPVESKKDAAFSNMMESLTAASVSKLSDKDEKGAALAASPQANANAQAAMQTATAAMPANVMPTQVTINTPVSHDKWGDEFNQKITWLTNQKEQTAELHLNPPQLGPMDVVLKVSGDQATALFTSPHAAVREAVEQALPRLREMLADSGIMLGNATVSDQAPRNRQENQGNHSSDSRSSVGGISDSNASGSRDIRVSQINRHNGIVDTFA